MPGNRDAIAAQIMRGEQVDHGALQAQAQASKLAGGGSLGGPGWSGPAGLAGWAGTGVVPGRREQMANGWNIQAPDAAPFYPGMGTNAPLPASMLMAAPAAPVAAPAAPMAAAAPMASPTLKPSGGSGMGGLGWSGPAGLAGWAGTGVVPGRREQMANGWDIQAPDAAPSYPSASPWSAYMGKS
jgi:hypothetical protein